MSSHFLQLPKYGMSASGRLSVRKSSERSEGTAVSELAVALVSLQAAVDGLREAVGALVAERGGGSDIARPGADVAKSAGRATRPGATSWSGSWV